jgi:kynurenine formamidase
VTGRAESVQFPPEDDVVRLVDTCSNEGRWGVDDELGALNLITDEKRIEAAQLVRTGRSVSIGRDLEWPSPGNNINYKMLFSDAQRRWTGNEANQRVPMGASDSVEVAPHGRRVTHLDALGHINFEGKMYNGRDAREVMTSNGLAFGSIYALRDGIFTRGVLLDIPRARGVEWVEAGDGIWRDDLIEAERLAGVRVEPGDAIFVRTGVEAREALDANKADARPGLMPDCLSWMHERDVAVYAGDCFELLPSPYVRMPLYFHMICLAVMGVPMLDNPGLEGLSAVARELETYEFLFTCAPARLNGATGWAVNPICVF